MGKDELEVERSFDVHWTPLLEVAANEVLLAIPTVATESERGENEYTHSRQASLPSVQPGIGF